VAVHLLLPVHGEERLSDTVSNGSIPLLLAQEEAIAHDPELIVRPGLLCCLLHSHLRVPLLTLPPLLHEPLDSGGGRASNGSRGGSRIVRHNDGRAHEILDRRNADADRLQFSINDGFNGMQGRRD